MGISLLTAAASTLTDGLNTAGLIAQLNAVLSTTLNSKVRGVCFASQADERVLGNELQVALTYDTSGIVMGAGFVAVGFQEKTVAAVKSAIDAYVAANPSYFVSPVWIQPIPTPRRGVQYVGLIFTNVNAAQGAANWVTDAGSVAVNVLTGNTLWVDAVNGNDATGAVGDQTKPFLTPQAAMLAASSGDTVEVRPGTYNLTQPIRWFQSGIGFHFKLGAVINGHNSSPILYDGGVAVDVSVTGDAIFNVGNGGSFIHLDAASTLSVECLEMTAPSVDFGGALQFGASGNQTVILNAKRNISCNGGGQPFARLDRAGITLSITSPTITADSFLDISFGAPVVRIAAGSITTGNYVVNSANNSPAVFIDSDTIVTGGPVLNFQGTGTPRVDMVTGSITCSGLLRATAASSTVRVRCMDITSDLNNNLLFLNGVDGQSVSIECAGDITCATTAVYSTFGASTVTIKAKNLAVTGGNPVVAAVDGNPLIALDISETLSGDNIIAAILGLITLHADVRARDITATTSVIQITHGDVTLNVCAGLSIAAPQILTASGTTSATHVSIEAPAITTTSHLVAIASDMSVEIDAGAITVGNANGILVSAGTVSRVAVACQTFTSAGYCVTMESSGFVTLDVSDLLKTTNQDIVFTDTVSCDVLVRAGRILNTTGSVVHVASGGPTITVEADSIGGVHILSDFGSTGATYVSIEATTITATNFNADGFVISNAAPAVYDICADSLVASVNNNGSAAVVNVTANRWTTRDNTTVTLAAVNTGTTFVTVNGDCTSQSARPILLSGGATVHLLGGRFIGFNDANGFAVRIDDAGALLRLYPGAVLIAGAAAANSIGLGGGAVAATVVAMGAIAANKAAAAGVSVVVGSLLVDPLVV